MQAIAVFVNDAPHARHLLQPLLQGRPPTRWILVACAPHLTRHAGRWLTQAARLQWRERWAAALFAELAPALGGAGHRVERQLARGPLVELSARLQARHPGVQLLDARAARFGQREEPVTAAQPGDRPGWVGTVAVTTGLSAMLTLAD